MAAHRYWRLNISANAGDANYLQIAEVEMRATLGGADQCTGGTASASTEHSATYAASKAVDDTASTHWSTPISTLTGWWAYDFGSAVEVLQYTIQAPPASPARSPKDWALEYSDNGTDWTLQETREEQTGWTTGEVRTFDAATGPAASLLSQQTVEVLSSPDPSPILTQTAVEVLILSPVDPVLSQLVVEVMTKAPPPPPPGFGALATLDYVFEGQPFVHVAVGTTPPDTKTLDYAFEGQPFYAQGELVAEPASQDLDPGEATITLTATGALGNDLQSVANISVVLSGQLGLDLYGSVVVPLSATDTGLQMGTELAAEDVNLSVTASPEMSVGTELEATADVQVTVGPANLETGAFLSGGEATVALSVEGTLQTENSLAGEASVAISIVESEFLLGQQFAGNVSVSLQQQGSLIVYPETRSGFFLLF